jgi:tetratricopeptide (TPR) repeat protein
MRKTLLVLLELILGIVIVAACSILIAGTVLPVWVTVVLLVVASTGLILFAAILYNPRGSRATTNQGLARARKGDRAGAIADYSRAIEIDPNCATAYSYRGAARLKEEDWAGAIADYSRAIELNPHDLMAYFNRGVARAAKGNQADAIADYTRAIELRPNLAPAYCNRGTVYAEQGYRASAIADFSRAIEIDPHLAPAYCGRGTARAEGGDWAGAIADYNEALRFSSAGAQKAWVYACRARGHAIMGDTQAACESLAAAIALDPQWRDLARTDPEFDLIRHEPCFQALIADPTTPP